VLDADIQLRLSRLSLDVAFSVGAGEVLALLGPNASGKSTTLRVLVGLLPLDGGRVVLDGTVLEDPAERGRVAPEKRPIALMFQDYLLFPHMSAWRTWRSGCGAAAPTRRPRARRRRRCWCAWILRRWPRRGQGRCPADSSSAWRWPVPW
jgi:molybdate transport system ATP-binding protein